MVTVLMQAVWDGGVGEWGMGSRRKERRRDWEERDRIGLG